ncbi:RNA-directed DNA polymerase [Variovorax sp. HW608]|uniref:group II intron reverse transcriptase/maturase n=1 Tax=Variovorax sp. HW608 TaxID=1034889 RepID=UPI00081FC251|nr:group II intron reverse transcriptase/maturase [Variovorax sp. HW608]SCK38872.1 RNA-directed DNA polymerase [Variovorax sp. HW608]SCK57491.1 RNA-directed DNA polymerase [Variovorax sp. HW608]SCK58870.1 RNA-directed DNA polymerase [Variovorax sp. HW608]
MSLGSESHQKPAGSAGRVGRAQGEARCEPARDESRPARDEQTHWGPEDLLGQALAKRNMAAAWKRVKANKGSAGVDGRTVEQTEGYLKRHWPDIRQSLLLGTYRPSPVRRVQIPKLGGEYRELGIPTVVDRLIQQALLQVLQPVIDPTFSEHSFGFRPGRSAHGAVLLAHSYVQQGCTVVVDVDLEKFFDRVNHDILMERLARRIADKAVLWLIRKYLQAGIMDGGLQLERHEGTPQGGPLSPLLANVMLDEVDRELERRGHNFVRYADDCNVYVKSIAAGKRVLAGLRRCYAKLRLSVNEAKTAVALVWKRKFLGYCFWLSKTTGKVHRDVAAAALQRYRQRVRQLTRRQTGRSFDQIAKDLQAFMPGWKAYFRLTQTPSTFRELDSWLRHRLRAIQLKFWCRGTTVFRELRALGASVDLAAQVAAHARRWWYCSANLVNRVLTNAYFDNFGIPRLC